MNETEVNSAPVRVHGRLGIEKERRLLLDWMRANLPICEDWLARRALLESASDCLDGLRGRGMSVPSAPTAGEPAGEAEVGVGAPAALPSRWLSFVRALRIDLHEYQASMTASRLPSITVVPLEEIPVPVFDPESRDLFVPGYVLDASFERMFAPSPMFSRPPAITRSWIFFQSLVIDKPHMGSAVTAASHLGIRESD
ncbi:hypothetical protein ACWESM_09785 [Nocardia sp. NPDC003999]